MSVDAYMKASLANQERIVALLEQIAANQNLATNVAQSLVLQPNHQAETTTVGSISETKVTPVREKSGDELLGDDKAALKKEAAASAGAAAASASASSAAAAAGTAPAGRTKADGKKVTTDDARKAVKAFAGIEGNDAAMELLASFGGAGSVSAVAEQGEDKLADLYFKAGGK